MMANFSDPFEALLAIQRALDAQRESDWMGSGTTGMGGFPPINIFQQGYDFTRCTDGSPLRVHGSSGCSLCKLERFLTGRLGA